MIQLINVEKTYSNFGIDTTAITDINLNIKRGEFVSIMGPSGCGKTSLLNIMGLLDKPTKGEVIFLGEVTANSGTRRRAFLRRNHIGFVFQSFNLIEELTIYENIELPLMYLKISASERKRRVEEIMERLHIAHKIKYFPQQISGGQQQRAAVARAVISKPSLILADEPTGNLDSTRGQEVMEILTELNESGTSIVMVTHSSTAAEYSQRVIHLFDGQLVTENLKKVTN
ncbi:MAG: ABC transporter ATP-binding protein [Bacteroidota bacterium]